GDVLDFHQLSLRLRQRTEDCLARAERAERPSSVLSTRWDEVVEQLTSEYCQQHQQMDPAVRHQPMVNGMRSRPESPSVRITERKLSLQMPPNFEDRTHIARLQAQQPQHSHNLLSSPLSASTTASTSQYPSSVNEQSHDEDTTADQDSTPFGSTSTTTEEAPSSNSEDDKSFFRGRIYNRPSGYGLT